MKIRILLLNFVIAGALCLAAGAGAPSNSEVGQPLVPTAEDLAQAPKVRKTDAEWKAQLTPEQYLVLRGHSTERACSSVLLLEHRRGVFRCAGCGAPLFASDGKFESGTGWPSFTKPFVAGNIVIAEDHTLGMNRNEVLCARCGGHLGHVFDDGPPPAGKRYCINGLALKFEPRP